MARDGRVETAVANWGPRFVANGVDPEDFRRIAGSVESWDDWCRAWSGAAGEVERLAEEAERAGRWRTAGQLWFRASLYHHFGKFLFVHRREEQRAAHERTVADFLRAAPWLDPPAERVEIPYEGWRLAALLHRPPGLPRPPVVLLFPGLDSVKEELTAYARDLVARGVAALAVDGPGQGEAEWEHPIEPRYERVATAVLRWLAQRQDLDGRRVGVMGVSLGGFFAARAAAFAPGLAAAVVLGGGYDVASHWDGLSELTRWAYAIRQGASTLEEGRELARRITLRDAAAEIRIPLLVIHGRRDRLIPWEEAVRLHQEARGPKELWLFEEGNHVCNNIPYRHRPQMADWLAERLGARG
ncbi:MAG: alpha/beta hydrolase [Bacillota bacterium]|nr:alpha/beta hydrolase [Bacillota bacterium]